MSINFNNLYYGHKIFELGSIKLASEELGLAPSTLSEHLKQLETTLGKPLFTRDKKGLTATPDGETFFRYTHLIFKTASKLSDHFRPKESSRTSLDIGMLPNVLNSRSSKFLLPLFANPEMYVKIHQADSQFLIKRFISQEFDIIITDYKLELSTVPNLVNTLLGSIEYALVYSTTFNEIKNIFNAQKGVLPFIQHSILSESHWMTEKIFADSSLELQIMGECDDIDLVKTIIQRSPRCALLPIKMIEEEINSGLISILHKGSNLTSQLYASYLGEDDKDFIKSAISSMKEYFK